MSTGSREISLSQGYVALVSEEDYPELSRYKWQLFKAKRKVGGYRLYAARSGGGRGEATVKMHRQILGATGDQCVDHIDGDGLNNSRDNLRVCTNQENSRNARISHNNTSGYKGVARFRNKWRAYLTVDAKQKHLGFFLDRLEAAHAYDRAARELFGNFARTNF